MRSIRASALAILISSMATVAQAQDASWEAIRPEDSGIELKFPGHPEVKDTVDGKLHLKLYTLFSKPGQAFIFAWSRYTEPFTQKTAEAELEMNVANFCKGANQTLQTQTVLSHQDPYLIEAIANGDGFKSWQRYYVHGPFVFGLVTLYNATDKAGPVPFDDMVTFLHSFRFLPASSK